MKKILTQKIPGILCIFGILCILIGCDAPPEVDLSSLIPAPGTYSVEIVRDSFGVPHIYGKTDADTAYGLAWAICEDDFKHVYETVLMARGLYACETGPKGLPFDFLVKLFRFAEIVEAEYEVQISPEMRAIYQAYTDGFNHFAALHPDKVAPGLLPARPQDFVTGSAMRTPFFFGMERQIRRLMGPKRAHEVSRPSEARAGGTLTNDLPIGSNTMAVAPSRTPDGKTHLAINSHQPFEGPVAWYEARLKSEEGLDITGGTFPGAPVILHGHNPDLGWAHTVNLPDLCDIYVLEMHPEDPNKYLFDGEYRELERSSTTIYVKLWGNLRIPIKRELLYSVHGPVIRRPHGVYAIRFAGYGDIRQIEQWYHMGKARTFEQFETAMHMGAIPSFNVGYADKTGNIWYLYNALLPLRDPRYDWRAYLPGDTSETLWTKYLPFDKLPQVKNPASGFIQNCNSTPFHTTVGPENPKPEDYCPSFGIEGPEEMTNRALRANELFGGDDSITEEEFYAYKFDWRYSEQSHAAKLHARMLELEDGGDPVMKEALRVLNSWDFSADPENTGAAIAILTMEPVVRAEMFGLNVPDLAELFKERAHQLQEVYGRIDVPWKTVNRLVRGDLQIGLGGGPDALNAIYGDWNGEHLKAVAGDCYVLMVTWNPDGTFRSQSIHQYGSATLDPESPHYADQAPLFAAHQLKPTWMDYDELMANARARYTPGKHIWKGHPTPDVAL